MGPESYVNCAFIHYYILFVILSTNPSFAASICQVDESVSVRVSELYRGQGLSPTRAFSSLPFTLSLSLSLSVSPNPFPLASALQCYSHVPSTEFSLHSLFHSWLTLDSCAKWIFSPGCHIHLVLLEWESILIFPWISVSSACISFLLSCKLYWFNTICVCSWQQCDAARSSVIHGLLLQLCSSNLSTR